MRDPNLTTTPSDDAGTAPAIPAPVQQARPRFFGTPRGPLGWVILFTRGLIFDQHQRRLTMFYVVLAAMLMAFIGDMFLGAWLRAEILRFAFYWLACAWLTITAALLAVYDLAMLRAQHRVMRRELRARMLGREHEHGPDGP